VNRLDKRQWQRSVVYILWVYIGPQFQTLDEIYSVPYENEVEQGIDYLFLHVGISVAIDGILLY